MYTKDKIKSVNDRLVSEFKKLELRPVIKQCTRRL